MTPRESVLEACAERGEADVVTGCVALVRGEEADGELIVSLGGPPAGWAVAGGEPGPDYWLRVWGLRGLLHAWRDDAAPAVVGALAHDAWRVREMAAKVCARRRIEDAVRELARLAGDPREQRRVRAAAERALRRITAGD